MTSILTAARDAGVQLAVADFTARRLQAELRGARRLNVVLVAALALALVWGGWG